MAEVWQGVLVLVGLAFLVVASLTDLKKREVPDWVSYGLIFSGLGLRLMFSFSEGAGIFLNGLLGFLACLMIAYLFYWTNQWGGGDSKLLMGMGAIIGLGWTGELVDFDFSLFWFFLGLLLFGAVMGLSWSLVLAVKMRKKFVKGLKGTLGSVKGWHYLAWLSSVFFLVLGLFYDFLLPLAAFPAGSFYLFCFVKVIEEEGFIKKVKVENLVEGDWLAEEVVVKGKRIAREGRGLEKEELRRLLSLQGEGKLKKVLVKEGIPFVPSFLLSYLVVKVLGLFGGGLGSGGWG